MLEHLLGDARTVPEDLGVFSSTHGECTSTSAASCRTRSTRAGRADAVSAGRTTPFGTGLRYAPVEHDGNRQESDEEAARVRAEIERMIMAA